MVKFSWAWSVLWIFIKSNSIISKRIGWEKKRENNELLGHSINSIYSRLVIYKLISQIRVAIGELFWNHNKINFHCEYHCVFLASFSRLLFGSLGLSGFADPQVDGPNTAEVALVKYIGHGMFTIFAGFVYIKKKPTIRKGPKLTVVTNPSPCDLWRIWVFTNGNIMESMGFLCPEKTVSKSKVRWVHSLLRYLMYSGICKIIHDKCVCIIIYIHTIRMDLEDLS